MTLSLALLITSLHCTRTSAFVPWASQQCKCHSHSQPHDSSALSVGISFDEETPDQYHQLLLRANDCAKDEECSLEEWETVMGEIEFFSNTESAELEHLMEGIHQLEERSSLGLWNSRLWNSRMFSRTNLPVFIIMFLASTYGTITAPYDDIVIRVGWYVTDWNHIASATPTSHFPLVVYAIAAYVALSEVISGYVPNE